MNVSVLIRIFRIQRSLFMIQFSNNLTRHTVYGTKLLTENAFDSILFEDLLILKDCHL